MRFFAILIGVSIFLFLCAVLQASEKLTWDDCVSMAAKSNPDIRAAHDQLKSSENLAKSAYSGFFPEISANGNINRGNSYSFSQLGDVPISTQGSDQTTSTASISAAQNIFSGFKDSSLIEQGKANKKASGAALDMAKVQISYDLKSAFANLYYAQKYLTLTEQIIKRRVENFGLVELRFEGGIENKGSVMLSDASVGQARYDKTVARDSIDVSRQQLARVLGMDGLKEFEIAGSVPIRDPGPDPDYKELAKAVPSYRKSVAEEESSKAGISLARSGFFPNIDFTGTVSAQGNNSFPNTSKRSMMLNMSLPIFSGGSDYFNTKSAAALYSASSYQRQSVENQLLQNLKKAYKGYVESFEKLKVDKAYLEAAEVRAEIARGKYNNGLLSFEDWDIIENDLITKQKTYLASERDRIVAEANWELVAGRGVIQ